MVETNPFKIEEAKWTPKNVYEILPPNAISYTGYDYSEGSTDFDQEKTRESLLDGFFGFFGDLLGGIGAIIGGAINIGGAILSPIINGIGNLIGGIANAIGSIFGGGPSTSPPPPLFNPIKTNLEAAIQPHLDQIEESKAAIEAARAEQLVIEGKIQEQGVITDEALGRARESIAEARAAKEAADEAIGKADAAVVKLEEYNTALKEEIRVEFHKATSTAEAAIAEAEAANVELGVIRGNMETGLASANSAIDEAKSLTAQVKAVADKAAADVTKALADSAKSIADIKTINTSLGTINSEIGAINNKTAELTTAQANINAELIAINGDIAPLSGRITDLNTELNQKTQALESGLGDANTAISEAKDLTAQVKAVADKNKADVASAISKADKANSDLSTLTPQVTKAQTDATKANEGLVTATSQVAQAQAVADKAIDWLKNPYEIGASLIAVDPETKKPNWAENLERVPAEENPSNLPDAYRNTLNPTSHRVRAMWINVDPGTEYLVSLWVKADKRGSNMTYDMRDQNSDLAFKASRPVEGFLNAGDNFRPFWIKDVPTEWTQYKAIITPNDSARKVYFVIPYFNHAGGSTTDAVQYIADFQIYPLVPSKLEIEQARATAEGAAAELVEQSNRITAAQKTADDAVKDLGTLTPQVSQAQSDATKAFTEAGKVRNEVTPKIEAAQTKGTEALAVADKAVDWLKNPVEIGTSLITVDPETRRPHYALEMQVSEDTPANSSGPSYCVTEGTSSLRMNGPLVPVDPNIKYTVSFWAKADRPGSIIYGQFENQTGGYMTPDGRHQVTGSVSVSNPPQLNNRNASGKYVHNNALNPYFIQQLELRTEWTYYEHEIQFTEGVTAVKVRVFFWNHNLGVSAQQFITDLDIRPQIPTQAAVDKAQNDAIKANADLLVQQGLINAAQGTINAHAEIFRDNQTKWNTAATNALDALNKFNANQTKWNDGTTKAIDALNKVNAGQDKWNTAATNAIDALNKFNDNQLKWNAASTNALDALKKFNDNQLKWNTGAATAIEANTAAIKALNAPTGGSSVVPMIPGTATPTWTDGMAEIDRGANTADTGLPERITKYYRAATGVVPAGESTTVVNSYTNEVLVDHNLEYEISWWVRCSAGSPRYAYVTLRSPTKGLYIVEKAKDGTASSNTWGTPVRAIITPVTTTWTKQTSRFKFAEGTPSFFINDIQFNNSTNTSNAYMYFADLQIAPKIPNQADVDEAQSKAIESHSLLFAEQAGWNATQEKLNKTTADFVKLQTEFNTKQTGWNTLQGQINDANTTFQNFQRDFNEKQIKWNTGAETATAANAAAIKAINLAINPSNIGSSLIAEDPDTGKPNWAQALTELSKSELPAGVDRGFRVAADNTNTTPRTMEVNIDPNIEYVVELWVKAGRVGSWMTYDMLNQDGALAFASRRKLEGELDTGDSYRPFWIRGVPTEWTKYKAVLKPKPTSRKVRFGLSYFRHSGGAQTNTVQYIAGFQMYPFVPSQAQVDDAQNRALEAHSLLFNDLTGWQKTQEKINDAGSTADNGLLQGLKALGRKDLGASLVPFQVPTDAEVKARNEGNLDYDPWARPEYFGAGHVIAKESDGSYSVGANSGHGTQSFVGSYVDIIQGTDYKVRFETYASRTGSRIFWYMYDQDNNAALEYTDFADTIKASGSLINGLTLPAGWNTWEGTIRFRPGVRRVSFRQFFWNHPSGVTATQRIRNLEIVPDVPSQTEVDELQNEAIRKTTKVAGTNTDAIAALADAVESMRQVQLLDGYYREQQRILDEEQDTRASMLQEIQKTQNEMISRTIVKQGTSTFDDYIDITGSTVEAKGTWAGQVVITHVYNGNTYINRYPVPDVGKTKPREWTVSSYAVSALRADYWVYAGTPKSLAISQSGGYISGSSFSSGSWGRIYYRSSFPDNNGNTIFRYNINLRNADRPTRYETRILINGKVEFSKYWTGRGPMFPHEDGADTLKVVWENPIPKGASVEIQGRTVSSTSSQAMVSSITGTIGYIEPSA